MLVGIPLDLTESFRQGTAEAPERIRLVSDSLETYSPLLDRDLYDIKLGDGGNLDLSGMEMPAALDAIEALVKNLAADTKPLLFGGEHTMTLAAVRGMKARYPDLAVIQLDAHLDLIDVYGGLKLSHATVMRRTTEEIGWQSLVQLGGRSGTKAEFQATRDTLYSSSALAMPPFIMEQLAARPIYLTLDIDVLDPAYAPGTGCPEPGGPSFSELLSLVHSFKALRIVGADINEVCPSLDSADITSITAAKLAREILLIMTAGNAPH
jgi:agmatinase